MRARFVAWSAAVAVLASCGAAPRGVVDPPISRRVDIAHTTRALFSPFTERHPGDLVVAIFDPSAVRFVPVRAVADGARRVYPLGSQAKLVVALTALQLHADGRVDLDRALAEDVPAGAAALTLREVLTHHGGLVAEPPSWEPPRGTYGVPDLLRDLEAHPPGPRVYRYSNFGYMVAAHVIERRLGTSFRDEADAYLSRFLGTTSGALGFQLPDALPRATLFTEHGEPPEPTVEPPLRWSCCLLEGNVSGLAALGQRLLTASGPAALALTPHRTRPEARGHVGMGTFQTPDGALTYNQGAMPGAYSALALDLREQRGVALVSGTNGPETGGLLLRALALLRVLRGDSPPPFATGAVLSDWEMAASPDPLDWWSLRPDAFGFDGPGIQVRAPHNTTLWFRRPLPAAGLLRLRVVPLTPSVDVKVDLLAPRMGLGAFGEDDVAGYRLILGGWNNTRSVLVAHPDEGNVVWEQPRARSRFAPGVPIELEIRYDAERLEVRVDGEPWLGLDRVDSPGEPRFLGVTGWASTVQVQSVSIQPGQRSAPTSAITSVSDSITATRSSMRWSSSSTRVRKVSSSSKTPDAPSW